MIAMKIIGLVGGTPCPFDGQYLVEYDPARAGVDPEGRPMLAHIVTTPDIAKAMLFEDIVEMGDCWKRIDPRRPVRPDGLPNRPLTAFSVVSEQVES